MIGCIVVKVRGIHGTVDLVTYKEGTGEVEVGVQLIHWYPSN